MVSQLIMRQGLHDKYYVRTPDLSVYEQSLKKLSPQKPKSAGRPFRLILHSSPRRINQKLSKSPDNFDQQLYYFPQTARSGRMTSEQFYRDFSCTGPKSNAIISNFLEKYLERKINKEIGQYVEPGQRATMKGKARKSHKYREKYRMLPQVNDKPDDRSTTLNTLRETLRWKQRFLAATTLSREKDEKDG